MTETESRFLREQIRPCWNFDAGVPHPENYTVHIRIDISGDGRITGARLLDRTRLSDPVYKNVAMTALAAVENPSCQPLRFPDGKYWPQLDLVFDLEKAINGG